MGMVMDLSSCFFISHEFWLLPVIFELLFRNLLHEQYQKSWFPVEWRAGMSCRSLSNLKMVGWFLLSRWRGWLAAAFLFFSKIGHSMGSASSRHAVLPLSA
jgi:hypothetical protein